MTVDADGDLDALFANVNVGNTLYTNDGAGSFAFAQGLGVDGLGMRVGDVDGDLDLDVVFANQTGGNRVFINAGCGDADLGITKTDSPDPVIAGNMLTYTVVVTNSGPDIATDVTVVDTLPASVTPGGVIMTNLGSIAIGGSTSFMISVDRGRRRVGDHHQCGHG